MRRAPLLALCLFAAACEPTPSPSPTAPVASAPAPGLPAPLAPPRLDAIPRLEFNRLAAQYDQPLFWIADRNGSGAIDPDEVAVLWGVGPSYTAWVKDGAFNEWFYAVYRVLLNEREHWERPGLDAAEAKRRAAVHEELGQGMPTLVRTDFRGAPPEDRAIVEHVLAAAEIIEAIFAKQRGSAGMAAQIPPGDAASRMLFYRNQGPWCEAPKTDKNPDCSALPSRPAHLVGLYPAALQKDPKFCEKLEARPDQKALLTPFNIVVEQNGDLAPVPYHVAYKPEMEAVSKELAAAAAAIQSPSEAAFKAYLEADAKAFLDGDWGPADEAWAKMGVKNSRWYLRVAPDEVYTDPCSRKAGFQVSFARINQDSIAWQDRLDPHKLAMEGELARLAGAPYKARNVTFHLPDFIDVILNAGDARSPLGATVGESLPNWGKVADEGRGRTVAMTNFYTDEDSRAAGREKAMSVLCAGSFDAAALDPKLQIMSTVLHEASHNLGPASDYRVKVAGYKAKKGVPDAEKGQTSSEIFGGPMASTLEELKAQTSAAYFADWLAKKGVIDQKTAALAHVSDILWGFGHISQGMYGGDGSVKPYAQLASIEVGSYLAAGAVEFRPNERAANGKDVGCFVVHDDKMPAAIASLEKAVASTMGRGDKAAAAKIKKTLVDDDGEWKRLRTEVIAERWLRLPRSTFVYSIDR